MVRVARSRARQQLLRTDRPAARAAAAAPSVCGNGVLDGGEDCDDGNAVGGDGCSAACAVEARRLSAEARTSFLRGMLRRWTGSLDERRRWCGGIVRDERILDGGRSPRLELKYSHFHYVDERSPV